MIVFEKIATDWWDDYTTDFLLHYNYLKNYYKMIATDLSKQQVLDADLKSIQKNDFIGNLARNPVAIATMFEEAKKSFLTSN